MAGDLTVSSGRDDDHLDGVGVTRADNFGQLGERVLGLVARNFDRARVFRDPLLKSQGKPTVSPKDFDIFTGLC